MLCYTNSVIFLFLYIEISYLLTTLKAKISHRFIGVLVVIPQLMVCAHMYVFLRD